MSVGAYQVPRDAGTVPVHVQVIDMKPFSLDLVVPTYLPARDLTQRVARDAGLGAYWPDGTRREYWLRARGRLLQAEEKLQDLGVVPYELLHLLPQPPPGSGLEERPPEYPVNKGYAAAGNLNVARRAASPCSSGRRCGRRASRSSTAWSTGSCPASACRSSRSRSPATCGAAWARESDPGDRVPAVRPAARPGRHPGAARGRA